MDKELLSLEKMTLHQCVCDAVGLLNLCVLTEPEQREAHNILRQALVDYADAELKVAAIIVRAPSVSPAELKPQLAHNTRQMFLNRIAKYNDPHNLEWEWDDITDKWERHAFSAFMDLVATEEALLAARKETLCRQ